MKPSKQIKKSRFSLVKVIIATGALFAAIPVFAGNSQAFNGPYNMTTLPNGNAIKPVLVDDEPSTPLADNTLYFGGAYAVSGPQNAGGGRVNPLTQTIGCPEGYASARVFSSDIWKVYVCYIRAQYLQTSGATELYGFGGLYLDHAGYVLDSKNPYTGEFGCPAGHNDELIPATAIRFCYRPLEANQLPSSANSFTFGGFYNDEMDFNNPATGVGNCPEGTQVQRVSQHLSGVNNPTAYWCYRN